MHVLQQGPVCKDILEGEVFEQRALIELPLEVFLDDSIVIKTEMETSYSKSIEVPAFKFEDYIVWGATAMIMSELKETIKSVLK